jgi:hypothetical protein
MSMAATFYFTMLSVSQTILGYVMNWNGFGRKWPWPDQGTIPAFAGNTEETHENPQYSWCPG